MAPRLPGDKANGFVQHDFLGTRLSRRTACRLTQAPLFPYDD